MKCNQCDSATITMGNVTQFCHEHGCPNTNKVYNQEDNQWETPEPEEDDEDFEIEEEGSDPYDDDEEQEAWYREALG